MTVSLEAAVEAVFEVEVEAALEASAPSPRVAASEQTPQIQVWGVYLQGEVLGAGP